MILQTIDCEFDKTARLLKRPVKHTNFPEFVVVHSTHTGVQHYFIPDHDAAMRNEFWDGMQMEYVPINLIPKVDRLVLFLTE